MCGGSDDEPRRRPSPDGPPTVHDCAGDYEHDVALGRTRTRAVEREQDEHTGALSRDVASVAVEE